MGTLSTSRPRMRVLVISFALLSTAMAGKGKDFMQMMGEEADGKMPDMMGKPSGGMMGKPDAEKPSKGEKDGLCLSNDQVHMMCGIGTKLQEKMDAALRQCVPPEMMAATMDDMQDMSMESDLKLFSSERGRRKNVSKGQKKTKKSQKNKKKSKKSKKSKKNKKPSKPSDFKSCEASCPSMDEMRSSAMEEMKTELCVLNVIGWMDDEGNMMQDVEDADMAEFPEAVREAVSEAKIKDCAEVATAAKMEAMMKDKKFQKKYGACFENECYSEEDIEAMTKMMEMMAGMQCWDRAFTKACKGHIKENLMNMASNMLNGK